ERIAPSGESKARNVAFAQKLSGRVLLQVQGSGEAWYVYPVDLKRYYLGRPSDAFRIMRELGLGISDNDLAKIPTGEYIITKEEAPHAFLPEPPYQFYRDGVNPMRVLPLDDYILSSFIEEGVDR
ncbi:MAG: hypothetical protein AAB855_00070, partial [Patescibacteria group bacterium]